MITLGGLQGEGLAALLLVGLERRVHVRRSARRVLLFLEGGFGSVVPPYRLREDILATQLFVSSNWASEYGVRLGDNRLYRGEIEVCDIFLAALR